VPPPGADVPPDEVLKALNIINVQGRGYMKATNIGNGSITITPVDPLEELRRIQENMISPSEDMCSSTSEVATARAKVTVSPNVYMNLAYATKRLGSTGDIRDARGQWCRWEEGFLERPYVLSRARHYSPLRVRLLRS
jgi:hypothetical protein